jgi:homoserine kinase type II
VAGGQPPGLIWGGEVLPPAATRVADELLRRYGLGPALEVQPAPGGLLNQNLVAVTAGGAYFLKGYRYAEPGPVAREHRVIAFVAASGLPVAAPLAAPGGQTVLRVGGRQWAVFPLLTDRQIAAPDLTPAHAGAMGRNLGLIHAALAAFPAPEAARYPTRLLWDSRLAADEMREYEAAIAAFPALTPFDQHALSSFAYRRTLLAAGVPPPEAFAGLPAQMLHGDYHEGNLFFGPDGAVTAVIDWELASVGPRALEIVRALDVALRATGDDPGAAERRRAFLHAYAAAAPLTRDECLAMAELYWAYRVHSLWVYEEHYRVQVSGLRSQVPGLSARGSARTDHLAMQDIAVLEWWLRNRHEVGRRLAADLEDAPRGTIVTARS